VEAQAPALTRTNNFILRAAAPTVNVITEYQRALCVSVEMLDHRRSGKNRAASDHVHGQDRRWDGGDARS
jgi:hypothetical protein